MRSATPRHLAMPAASSGLLMAVYLLARPYGDAGSSTSTAAAEAFASTWWVLAHLAGALALVQQARVGLRIDDLLATTATRVARWAGLAGVALVLPYYGPETFGLHAIGRAGLSDPSVLPLVEDVRNHPAAQTTFGLGLLLLATSGIATALAWRRAVRSGRLSSPAASAWPFALGTLLLAPQFFLPPEGRMAYGVLFAVAGMILAVAAWRAGQSPSVLRPRETTFLSGAKTTDESLSS